MVKRSIGPMGILLAAVGGIIGSGWLFGPYYASQIAGPAALISWAVGGILMIFIALTFAELTSMLPVVGGVARFSHFSHGPLVSFTMSWCGWISSIVVAPIETMALLQYAANYIPNLARNVGMTHELTPFGIFIAAIIMLIMCIVNAYGIRLVTKTNAIIVVLKLGVPIFTAIILMSSSFHGVNFTTESFAPYGIKGVLAALPAAGVIFSFIGYNPAIQLAGESKNPQKVIPIAIIGSLIICIFLYLLVQAAFIGSVDTDLLKGGWKALDFKGDSGPFAGIARHMGLIWLAIILYIDAAISPFGTALIYTSAAARMNYAMTENGYLPLIMQKLNKKDAPIYAIGLNYILGLILFLPFPGWQSMVTFLVSAFVISYAVGPISLVALRHSMAEKTRPFKLPCEKICAPLAFYICNLLAFWTGWATLYKILILIAIGYLFLTFYKLTKHGRPLKLNFIGALWLFPYFAGLGMISYLGTFGGGKGMIPFGWDFFVLFLFSIVIFILAYISRIKPTRPSEKKVQESPVI